MEADWEDGHILKLSGQEVIGMTLCKEAIEYS